MNRLSNIKQKLSRGKLPQSGRLFSIVIILMLMGLLLSSAAMIYSRLHVRVVESPLEIVSRSRNKLFDARRAQAAVYAPDLMAEAEYYWERALQEWNKQNNKAAKQRDYILVRAFASGAILSAQKAIYRSQTHQDSLRECIRSDNPVIRDKITQFKNRFTEIYLDQSIHDQLVKAEVLLSESVYALQRDELLQSNRKALQAAESIEHLEKDMDRQLKNYFAQVPLWQSWFMETVQRSGDDSIIAIIVDKMARQCKIYHYGDLIMELPVELGKNWIGPKRVFGDDATPEGKYHIKKKKEGKDTSFFLALEIDYPNSDDWARFSKAKSSGVLPMDARVGGEIEIHGGGGEEFDWTNGCVALKNEDMKILYQLTRVGTPVTIVGALNSDFAALKHKWQINQ